MILDSTYVFDLMAGNPDALRKGVEVVERGDRQWLPVPVVAEAFYGGATERSDTTEREVKNRLRNYPEIDVNDEIARVAGRLYAEADDREGSDSGVEATDTYIAATAELLDQSVLTTNVADFEKLGVLVETY